MKGTLLVYQPGEENPRSLELDRQPFLHELQTFVGGYIEQVPKLDMVSWEGENYDCIAFCNEEGKLKRLDRNLAATELWRINLLPEPLGDILLGPVVVCFGDEDFMKEWSGE